MHKVQKSKKSSIKTFMSSVVAVHIHFQFQFKNKKVCFENFLRLLGTIGHIMLFANNKYDPQHIKTYHLAVTEQNLAKFLI